MGTRYEIKSLECPYCGEEVMDIYFAPSSGIRTVKCGNCGKWSEIVMKFELKKILKDIVLELLETRTYANS